MDTRLTKSPVASCGLSGCHFYGNWPAFHPRNREETGLTNGQDGKLNQKAVATGLSLVLVEDEGGIPSPIHTKQKLKKP